MVAGRAAAQYGHETGVMTLPLTWICKAVVVEYGTIPYYCLECMVWYGCGFMCDITHFCGDTACGSTIR